MLGRPQMSTWLSLLGFKDGIDRNFIKKDSMQEPHNLRRWRNPDSPEHQSIYTCARPGRSAGRHGKVSDETVLNWFEGLPPQRPLTIISLLGEKPDGTSEYSYYSFQDSKEFKKWTAKHIASDIEVLSFETVDFHEV